MLTNLEQQTLSLIKAACKQYISEEDKWEQRRWELATRLYADVWNGNAEAAIQAADGFIEQYKKTLK